MLLYVNGDSHSAGHDAGGPEFSYGRHLATHYNADFVCDAEIAACNKKIIRSTREYLQYYTPDLIIIGWSTWEREEWEWDGKFFNITASGTDIVPRALRLKYKQWVVDSDSQDFQISKEVENHNLIWEFHNELKNKNIKHLFFNCYSHFYYINSYSRPQYPWGNSYIAPYDQLHTYYFWLANQNFKPSNPMFYHYGPDAHRAWADFLIPYIDNL